MSSAIVDLDELLGFLNYLVVTLQGLHDVQRMIDREFIELSEYWKDIRFKQLQDAFQLTQDGMASFLKESDHWIDYLVQKENAARKYLEGR